MRIVGGKWAGKKLASPSGRVRPTSEELRGAWLDLLERDLKDARCLDLFAGTGALGLEALSRGAKSCDFVENGASAMHSLKANVAAMKAKEMVRIFDRDAIPFVNKIDKIAYDVAFADPPYGSLKLDRILERWVKTPFSRILSVEHAPDHKLPTKGKSKRVGDSVVTILVAAVTACASAPRMPDSPINSAVAPALPKPPIAGVDGALIDRLDSIMSAAIRDSITPTGAIAIGRHGQPVVLKGWSATDSTLYDLASLTKVVATTTAAMALEEDSLLNIERTVVSYLPEFNAPDKSAITIRMLLLHRSGIKQVGRLPASDVATYVSQINAIPLQVVPGERTEYTDWNMIVLQAVIERITGKPLDLFVRDRIFNPLGMHDTRFNPPERTVHDPIARALGGVSGNAGLFSSARDLALFAQMMLNGGTYNGVRVLEPQTIARWTARQKQDASRALGWDTPADSSSAGPFMSAWSFGHTGFTGTSIWIDPQADMYVVLLTNYFRPSSNNPRIRSLRRAVNNAARSAIVDMPLLPATR